MNKVCNRCLESKPLDCFSYAATNADRRRHHCKACQRLEDQERYAANPQPFKDKSLKWQRDNPEERKAIKRRWDKKRREKASLS